MMDEKQASLVLSVDPASYEYATRFRHTRCNELWGLAWQSRWAHLANMQNNVNKLLNYAQQKVYPVYIYIYVCVCVCVCTNWTVFMFTHYIHTSYLRISYNHHKYSVKISLNIFIMENQFFSCDTGKECLHNIYTNFSRSIFFTKNKW